MFLDKPVITGSSGFQMMDGRFKLSAAEFSLAS